MAYGLRFRQRVVFVMPKNIKHNRCYSTEAGKWMAENGHAWTKPKTNNGGSFAKHSSTKHRRLRRSKVIGDKLSRWESVKDFTDAHRDYGGHDCLFVPAAQRNVPASVSFLGKDISAARYMCILTHGAPKHEGAFARHLCGNGHLSCVNPKHIVWGDRGDNQSDANHHRAIGDNVQDRINSVTR